MTLAYTKNALPFDSPQMKRIQNCAAQHKLVVVLGFTENRNHSLYISQVTIDSDGSIVMKRSKIKATHMERTIFGDSSADGLNAVADTQVGRVGTLACWEHIQPLLKYHTYSRNEQIHVSAWPPVWKHGKKELWSLSSEGASRSSSTIHGSSNRDYLGINI